MPGRKTRACQKFSALSLAASPKPAKEDPTKKIEADFVQKAAEKAGIEKSIFSCADACVKNGLKKPMTDCQTNAASLDDYSKCK